MYWAWEDPAKMKVISLFECKVVWSLKKQNQKKKRKPKAM